MKLSYIIIFFLLVAGWFYWFQYRPMNLRKTCYYNTFGAAYKMLEQESYDGKWIEGKVWTWDHRGFSSNNWGWYYPVPEDKVVVEQTYAECLMKNGMKPEKALVQ